MKPTTVSMLWETRAEAVTSQEMRQFAAECMRWSDETDNASHRELIIRVAKSSPERRGIPSRSAQQARLRTAARN
jgi:hypothetical protein